MLGYQAQDKLDDSCLAYGWKNYAILLFPIAPHLSAEIFSKVSNSAHNIEKAQWPIADPKFLDENNITIIIQINGKLKAKFKANNDISKDEQEKTALEHEDIIRRVKDLKIKKVITIPKKIVNIVAI